MPLRWLAVLLFAALAVLLPGRVLAGGSPDAAADAPPICQPLDHAAAFPAHLACFAAPLASDAPESASGLLVVVVADDAAPLAWALDPITARGPPLAGFQNSHSRCTTLIFAVHGAVGQGVTLYRQAGCSASNYEFAEALPQYFLRARNYDAGVGRFATADKWRGANHQYSYCEGSPIGHVDPSGNFSLGEAVAVGAGFGALAGGTVGYIRGGLQGAAYGAIAGAAFGALSTAAVLYGGVAISAASMAGPAQAFISPQIASWVLGSALGGYSARESLMNMASLEPGSPSYESEMHASEAELAFTVVGWGLGTAGLGRSYSANMAEAAPVRAAYKQASAQALQTAMEVLRGGGSLESAARTAFSIRHAARLSARAAMSQWLSVAYLPYPARLLVIDPLAMIAAWRRYGEIGVRVGGGVAASAWAA